MDDSRNAIRQRLIPWDGFVRSGLLSSDEASRLSELGKYVGNKNYDQIEENIDLYTTTALNVLSKITRDDIIKYLLNLIIELLHNLDGFKDTLLKLKSVDASLPFQLFLVHLNSSDEEIKLLSVYNLVVLYKDNQGGKEGILKLYNILLNDLINSSNANLQSIAIQCLAELLASKHHRTLFWVNHTKYVPYLVNLLSNKKSSLQVQYLTLLSLWLLSFNSDISYELALNYQGLIKLLINIAKDSIKEKIVRLAVSILLNFIRRNEIRRLKIIKIVLLNDGLPIINNLNDRKWADEELISDLSSIQEILNENFEKLTSFDEYLIELDSGNLSWSPPHRSKEFWMNYNYKFKENNYRIFKQLINLLNKILASSANENLTAEQEKNNNKVLSVICNDICQIITYIPESLVILNKTGNAKSKIMELMTSKDVNLRYEALKTTQVLVSHSI